MPQVTIVGAGIAGLAAALRLVERGFDVIVLEQDGFLGGKLGAHTHDGAHKADYHEHSYHMYTNWYRNFWQIIHDVGIFDHFAPETRLAFLRPGRGNQPLMLTNVGTASSFWQNIFCGVEPPVDMLLYTYSIIDILATLSTHRHRGDTTSVSGLVASRPYATHRSIALHGETLAKAFAVPTDMASLNSYRNFLSYGFRHPDPMMWLLKGDTQQYLFEPLEKHLRNVVGENRASGGHAGIRIRTLTSVEKIHLKDGEVTGLEVAELRESPTIASSGRRGDNRRTTRLEPVSGDVILAIPPGALSRLVDLDVLRVAPELGNVRKLRSEPMATLNLYFKRKLADIPREITILLESKYKLSFLDNSQRWQQTASAGVTFLNVCASDFDVLAKYTSDGDYDAVKEALYRELSRYIEFHYDPVGKNDDIDRERSSLQSNVGEELFTNDVGTWKFRPETTCNIRNLFIAGDYCKTFIDVVTIEGAVVSGLMAAEAVRKRAGTGEPITILRPETYPDQALAALKMMGAPYAYAAKAWSVASNALRSSYDEMFPNG
ncbi:MAG: FAD-dependent oxidoreductase [Stellaceae bacterium]